MRGTSKGLFASSVQTRTTTMSEGLEVLHGPGSSAERPSVKKSRKQLEAGKAYWKERIAKLNRQRPEATSEVLRGVVVYFEGYTDDMTAFQLKKLVYSNGGEISHYFSKKKTTHVVCTNLCNSKAQRVGGSRIRVVHPDWIRLSCKEGRKLPEDNFLIIKDETIKSIDSFFTRKLAPLPPAKKQKVIDVRENPPEAAPADGELELFFCGLKDDNTELAAKEELSASLLERRATHDKAILELRRGKGYGDLVSADDDIAVSMPYRTSTKPSAEIDALKPSASSHPSQSSRPPLPPVAKPLPTTPKSSARPSPLTLHFPSPRAKQLTLEQTTLPEPLNPPSRTLPPPSPAKPPRPRKPVNRESLVSRFSPNKSFVDQFPSADTRHDD